MIIDYWGCGLYRPLMTFLFSIMHIHLVFFIYRIIHLSIHVCRGCGWKMLQCYMEATQLRNIFSWALYHTHVRVWFLLIYLPLWTASVSKLFCIAKCAQHFILAGRAACISTISSYMLVQNIGNKSFCVYTSCFCRRRLFKNYILFEDKIFGITHGLICLSPRVRVSCHLRK